MAGAVRLVVVIITGRARVARSGADRRRLRALR